MSSPYYAFQHHEDFPLHVEIWKEWSNSHKDQELESIWNPRYSQARGRYIGEFFLAGLQVLKEKETKYGGC